MGVGEFVRAGVLRIQPSFGPARGLREKLRWLFTSAVRVGRLLMRFLTLAFGVGIVAGRGEDLFFRQLGRQSAPGESMSSPRVLMITGYYFRNHHMLIDGVLALALRRQGADVCAVSTGSFFRRECPYFGGIYSPRLRGLEIAIVRLLEKAWWEKILRLPHFFITDWAEPRDVIIAEENVGYFSTVRQLSEMTFKSFEVGVDASNVTLNMRDARELEESPDYFQAMQAHCKNIIRYHTALDRMFDELGPERVVSNSPFYYKWSVPYAIAAERQIPFYSYAIADKPNSIFFTLNPQSLRDPGIDDIDSLWSRVRLENSDIDSLRESFLDFWNSKDSSTRPSMSPVADFGGARSKMDLWATERESGKTIVLVPLNVPSDAATLQGAPFLSNQYEFIRFVLKVAESRPNYEFWLKVHPHEHLYQGHLGWVGTETVLRDLATPLPQNVHVIESDVRVRMTDLLSKVDGLLCYTSTVAMEAAIAGVPTAQLGYSHSHGRAFINCPINPSETDSFLDSLLEPDSRADERATLAVKYFILHYFYAQVDFGIFKGSDLGPPSVLRENLDVEAVIRNTLLTQVARCVLAGESWFCENPAAKSSGKFYIDGGAIMQREG